MFHVFAKTLAVTDLTWIVIDRQKRYACKEIHHSEVKNLELEEYHVVNIKTKTMKNFWQETLVLPVTVEKQVTYDFSKSADAGNSTEIFPLWFLMITIMMWCSFKSQHTINFNPAHLNK